MDDTSPDHQPGSYDPPVSYQPPAYEPPPPFAAPPERAAPLPGYQPYQPMPYPPTGPGGYPPGSYLPVGYQPIEPTRRRAPIVAAIVAVLALGGLGIAWWATSNSTPDRMAVPANFDGYERLTGPPAQRVESAMRSMGNSMGGGSADLFNAATIAVYGRQSGDLPVLVVFALRTSAVPASIDSSTPDSLTQAMLNGATADNTPFPPGPHGGASRCGSTQFGAVAETMCSWSDSSTTGMLVSVREGLSPSALSQVALSLRDQID